MLCNTMLGMQAQMIRKGRTLQEVAAKLQKEFTQMHYYTLTQYINYKITQPAR